MQESPEPNVDDQVLRWIASGKRSKALLALYRSGNGSLSDAWYLMNGLGDDPRFEHHDHDFAYLKVTQYLEGEDPWKEKAIFFGAGILVTMLGLGLIAFVWPRFKTGLDSYGWPKMEATILNVRHYEETSYEQDRGVTREYLSYQYAYTVGTKTYKPTVHKRPFYSSFGDQIYALGEKIEIVYNPDAPQESIHKRFMYGRTLWVVVGAIIALIGIAFLGLMTAMQWSQITLKRTDRRLADWRLGRVPE